MSSLIPKLSEKAILEIDRLGGGQYDLSGQLCRPTELTLEIFRDMLDVTKYPITEAVLEDYVTRAKLRPCSTGGYYVGYPGGRHRVITMDMGADAIIFALHSYFSIPIHIAIGELLGWWLEPKTYKE